MTHLVAVRVVLCNASPHIQRWDEGNLIRLRVDPVKEGTGTTMGLFGNKLPPVVIPPIRRADIAAAVAATPPKEQSWLTQAHAEIDYLSDLLPADEPVQGVARCAPSTTIGFWVGVILLTPLRLAAVYARYEKSRIVGEPTVQNFPFTDVSQLSFVAEKYLNVAYIDTKDGKRTTLEVGRDPAWTTSFMSLGKQTLNRSKF